MPTPLSLPFIAAQVKFEFGPPDAKVRQFRITLVRVDDQQEIADPSIFFDVELVKIDTEGRWEHPDELEVGGIPSGVTVDPSLDDGAYDTSDFSPRALFGSKGSGSVIGSVVETGRQGAGEGACNMVIRPVRSGALPAISRELILAEPVVVLFEMAPAG